MIRRACNLCDATIPSDGVCPECGNNTSHVHESHVLPSQTTIDNTFPDLPTRTTKYCPHEGCEYGLVIAWYAQDGPSAWVTMPPAQMEWLLQRHLETHLDPAVRDG